MTIYQSKDRCWELRPPTDDERRPHFTTEADALAALTEDRGEDGAAFADSKPVRLDAPCWQVQCDGECEMVLDEEGEGYIFHHDTRAEAEQSMVPYHWAFGEDGRVFCEADAPPGSVSAYPSPAEQEAAGQLVLPGAVP